MVHTASVLLVFLFQIIEDKKQKSSADNVKKKRLEDKDSLCRPVGWCPNVVGPTEANEGLHQLFVYLGYFCLQNIQNQEIVACGTPPSLLLRLCRMPIRYLTDSR